MIDTNQWITHLMLRSPTAAAVLYSLRQQDGVVGLPHVVEEELKRHAVYEGQRARDQVAAGLDDLRRLLGYAPSPSLPSDDLLNDATARRLAELDPFLRRVAFTFDQAQKALQRVLDKVPPNSERSQQYKDTLIWLGVLELATDHDVLLVTADKAFYANRDPSKGLAPELLADLDQPWCTVAAMDTLGEAAKHLQSTQPPVDVQAIAALIDDAVLDRITAPAAVAEFTVGPLIDSELHVYATEMPDVVAVTFTITHTLQDLQDPPRSAAEAVAEGDCEIRADQVREVRPHRVILKWLEPTGRPVHIKEAYGYGGVTVSSGERSEPYTVRTEINVSRP